jgi:integrase
MRLYKRKGTPHWWATWNDQDGKRHRRSSGVSNRKLAEALAAKWVKEDFLAEHFGKKPEVPFSEALLRYAEAQKRDHPRHFMDKTRYRLRFLAQRFKGFDVSDFTYRAVQEFIDERAETVSSGMILRDTAIIKAIINKARREGFSDFVPNFPRIRPSKPRNRWMTVSEERRLIAAAAPHLKSLIKYAVDTGGRLSELLGLDWRQVDLIDRRVTFLDTKNGEDRTVRLCARAFQTLLELGPKKSGPVFTFHGEPIKSVKTSFSSARKKAGIADLRFHDLRHTFASRLVQGGVPLYDVMHLTGHKSLSMVQRYSHLAPDFQEGAMRVLDALGHNLGTDDGIEDVKEDAKSLKNMVPQERLELPTRALRMRCSTI